MAVTEYINSCGTNYSVYVNIRSKSMPHIRFQKRIKGIKSKAEAKRKEKGLIQNLSQKVAHVEGHGFTWEMIISKWAGEALNETSLGNQYNPTTVRDYVSMLHLWTSDWLNSPATLITRGDGKEVLQNVILNGRSKAF